jgi:hypothetical protein
MIMKVFLLMSYLIFHDVLREVPKGYSPQKLHLLCIRIRSYVRIGKNIRCR